MHVRLKNDQTSETKEIEIGWSWSLFLLTPLFGFVLYRRGLDGAGRLVSTLCVGTLGVARFDLRTAYRLSDDAANLLILGELALICAFIGLSIYFAIKGNELTAKKLLSNDWSFADEGRITQYAKAQWCLA